MLILRSGLELDAKKRIADGAAREAEWDRRSFDLSLFRLVIGGLGTQNRYELDDGHSFHDYFI
jgi:hypothetical protein